MTTTPVTTARVAVVTGGSRGIGRSCAQHLAGRGFSVVLAYATSKTEAEDAVTSIERAGGNATAVQADVADEHQAEALFDTAERSYGGVDVVVQAAGKMALAALADMDLAVLDDMLRTNIRGTFVVNQQAVRRVRPGGSIVNFSSSVLGRMLPSYTGYAASKGAVEAMTFILASELRGKDITVNTVAPGPTATVMFLEGKDEDTIEFFAKAPPLGRLGTPEDIAEVVGFLTSPAGHWVNGQTIRVNGGVH